MVEKAKIDWIIVDHLKEWKKWIEIDLELEIFKNVH
jgi:hypothetical protein